MYFNILLLRHSFSLPLFSWNKKLPCPSDWSQILDIPILLSQVLGCTCTLVMLHSFVFIFKMIMLIENSSENMEINLPGISPFPTGIICLYIFFLWFFSIHMQVLLFLACFLKFVIHSERLSICVIQHRHV